MVVDTNAPKVSFVVPAYNSGPHSERLVVSLLRQSLPPGENSGWPSRPRNIGVAHAGRAFGPASAGP
ncbi:glycosyltransferase [Micromonospora sp. NPDC002296]|uniref:glycosyltransferase n=1 Tax=Micromonospora sp. NPDC002296 TaxID=3154271 RepID=UPI00331DA74E